MNNSEFSKSKTFSHLCMYCNNITRIGRDKSKNHSFELICVKMDFYMKCIQHNIKTLNKQQRKKKKNKKSCFQSYKFPHPISNQFSYKQIRLD